MADIPVVNRHNHSMGVGPYHTRGMPVAPASSACQMLAAAVKFRLLPCLLTVLATVLSVRTTLRDHALAAWVSALVRLGHDWVPPSRRDYPHAEANTSTTEACRRSATVRGCP
jgi:hypothetical protein